MRDARPHINLSGGSAKNWQVDLPSIKDAFGKIRKRIDELSTLPQWSDHDETALEVLQSLRALFRDSCRRYQERKRELAALDYLDMEIEAVYQRMLPLQPLRFLLADDPGAGKTIMSGLYIRELMIRGDVERVLIVAPGSLVVQWQDELWHRFGLEFEILSREMVETVRTGNPFTERPRLIARLDQVARNEDLLGKLDASRWDLIVVDEAHKMSAHYFGNKLNKTMRYQLGERLGLLTRHLLLLTATPHSGKPDSFLLFLALLDDDRFGGRQRNGSTPDVSDIMRRSVKEDLLTFDGKPLFPERRAYSAKYELSPLEQNLYEEVTHYVRKGMDKAKEIEQKDRRRGLVVGFALTALQRRLASSPEAIYHSLRRRRERLENRLVELEAIAEGKVDPSGHPGLSFAAGLSEKDIEYFDFDEYDDEDREQLETEAIDQATAAATVPELRKEIEILHRLVALAADVRRSGTDKKWDELSSILQSKHMTASDGAKRKMIVFTEHKDTLEYLRRRIVGLLGGVDRVVVIHGSVRRQDRRRRQDAFVNVPEVEVMVATDAAGTDDVLVGRIRSDVSHENGVAMWRVADNLRCGAATNAVRTAELLIQRDLLHGAAVPTASRSVG